ncbi:MAG: VWA domain-containing protein [Chloroflexi bacterium]|nr:VWA domain-containing protein [Chloroflexota bacterium]
MPDRPEERSPENGGRPAGATAPYEWHLAFATELFSAPDLDSTVLVRLRAGAGVVLLEEHGAFRLVQTSEGRVGYVGKLALARSRAPAAQAAARPDEPPPLPWELERLGGSAHAAESRTAPAADEAAAVPLEHPAQAPEAAVGEALPEPEPGEPPSLPWELERLGAQEADVRRRASAAGDGGATPLAVPSHQPSDTLAGPAAAESQRRATPTDQPARAEHQPAASASAPVTEARPAAPAGPPAAEQRRAPTPSQQEVAEQRPVPAGQAASSASPPAAAAAQDAQREARGAAARPASVGEEQRTHGLATPTVALGRSRAARLTAPLAADEPRRRRRGGLVWLTALPGARRLVAWLRARRLRQRAPAALGAPPATMAAAGDHRRRRRALGLLAALLLLVGLFEALAWTLGLLGQSPRAAGEPSGSPLVAAVRGADGRTEVSVDTRAVAGAAGVSVIWIVVVVSAAGTGAALPAAAALVPAMGLTAALNAATGLTPPEKVLLLDLSGTQAAAGGGPAVALRQVTRERVTLTMRNDVVDRLASSLPSGPPPPAPVRSASIPPPAPPAAGSSTLATIVVSETVETASVPRPPGSLDVGFVLDASGSMLERLGGRQKIDIAKEVLNDFVGSLQPTVQVGLWVYGHRRGDRAFQCQQIELLYPISAVQPQTLRERINEVTPFGWTPIAKSIELAARDFRRLPGIVEVMVLISDGEETCGGDPVKAVREARQANADLTVHAVGLAVTPETRQQLEGIAAAGGGRYYDASDAASLAAALAAITRPAPAGPAG